VTHTCPATLAKTPEKAEEIPFTIAVGYTGSVYLNGCERAVDWSPGHLQIGQRVGILITDDGRGDVIIFEDHKPVVCIDGDGLREAGFKDAPLYPVVELFGGTSGVTLCPRASLPPSPWSLPTPPESHRQSQQPVLRLPLLTEQLCPLETLEEDSRMSPQLLSPVLEPTATRAATLPSPSGTLQLQSTQNCDLQVSPALSEKHKNSPSRPPIASHRGPGF